MTFEQHFRHALARQRLQGTEPKHCYLGLKEWADFRAHVELNHQLANPLESPAPDSTWFAGVRLHRTCDNSHLRFS